MICTFRELRASGLTCLQRLADVLGYDFRIPLESFVPLFIVFIPRHRLFCQFGLAVEAE